MYKKDNKDQYLELCNNITSSPEQNVSKIDDDKNNLNLDEDINDQYDDEIENSFFKKQLIIII
jgi:hypothetical protein